MKITRTQLAQMSLNVFVPTGTELSGLAVLKTGSTVSTRKQKPSPTLGIVIRTLQLYVVIQ